MATLLLGAAATAASAGGAAAGTAATVGTAAAGTAGAAAAGTAATAGLFGTAGSFSLMSTLSTIGSLAKITSGIAGIGSGIASREAAKGSAKQYALQGRQAEVQALQDANAIREQTLQRLASARAGRGGTGSVEEQTQTLRFGNINVGTTKDTGELRSLQSEGQASQLRKSANLAGLTSFTRAGSLISSGAGDIGSDLR